MGFSIVYYPGKAEEPNKYIPAMIPNVTIAKCMVGAKAVPTNPTASRIPEVMTATRQLYRSIKKLDRGPASKAKCK